MADLAKWVTAAKSSLGWEPGQFLEAYNENRRHVVEASFEADVVAVAIRDWILGSQPDGWTGTMTELFGALNATTLVSDSARRSRLWPVGAQALGNRIERIAPLLRSKGFTIERRRHGEERLVVIVPPAKVGAV